VSGPPELAARLFRRLYADYDLITVDGVTMAMPSDGTPVVFTGDTLSEIALQIADYRGAGR
jgi:hypothetical protein